MDEKRVGGGGEYDYGRSGNRKGALLEEKLGKLEGGSDGFAYA
ncbi:hypothetical protein [Staphylococcus saprophyticus]|nr:hypothetical protein [Staphylococcus saprophyticus]